MKLRKRIISMLVLGAMCIGFTAGCAPAADNGGAAAEGSGASAGSTTSTASGEYESLDAVNVEEFATKAAVEDFISADVNISATKEDGTPWKIGWLNPDASDESMAYMDQVMKKLGGEMGFEMVSFDAQSDPQKQTDQLNNAVNQGCDAIIINPLDNTSAVSAMKAAKDKGIVVINCQNVVNDDSAFDCYVGPDDTQAGQIAASLLIDAMPDGGKVCVIEGMMGSTAQINRDAGFMGVMQNHPEFEILDMQSANWSTAEAMNIMESDLAKFEQIDAVFSHFDLATLAAIQSAENAGRDKDITFVSVDGTQGAIDKIGQGSCFLGTAMQDFNFMSVVQIDAALAFLNGDGEKIEKIIMPNYLCVTADNSDGLVAGWG